MPNESCKTHADSLLVGQLSGTKIQRNEKV